MQHPIGLTAIAMAIPASVTVSMGEETRGVFSVIFLVRAEVKSWGGKKNKWGGHMNYLEEQQESWRTVLPVPVFQLRLFH